jgi:hypothetical protein
MPILCSPGMDWPTSAMNGGFRPPGALCMAQHITCSAPPSPRLLSTLSCSGHRSYRRSEPHRCPVGYANLKRTIEPCTYTRTRVKEVGSSNFGPHEGEHWIASVVFRRTRREVVPKSASGKSNIRGARIWKHCFRHVHSCIGEALEPAIGLTGRIVGYSEVGTTFISNSVCELCGRFRRVHRFGKLSI